MADQHHAGDHGHGDVFRIYMIVAVALSVCTAASFLVNQSVSAKFIAFLLILAVAIVKAVLVGMYFMHLKWDWKLLYYLIIPVFIMGTMMMVVLLPDTVLGPSRDAAEAIQIAEEKK